MNIIEQATRRLEQLERAGISVPWSATSILREAGLLQAEAEAARAAATLESATSTAVPALHVVGKPIPSLPAPKPVPPEPRQWGRINLDLLRESGYIVPELDRTAIAEQFKHVKRELFKNTHAHAERRSSRGALMMVTSALPGEGKTFCSINLAMSMAMEIDTSVILIDADVIRPSLFTRMGVELEGPGLLDLLSQDGVDLADTLVSTNVPKLTLMSSGTRRGQSTEWLASESMMSLLDRFTREYPNHVVIFDAPPLLLTSESAALASKVGQVIMVVEASKTRRHAVQEAYDMLKQCPTVLSVLNKGMQGGDGGRYGYYYQ